MTITEPKPTIDPAAAVTDEMIDAVMAGVDAGGLELLGPDGVLAELTKRLLERSRQSRPRPAACSSRNFRRCSCSTRGSRLARRARAAPRTAGPRSVGLARALSTEPRRTSRGDAGS